MILGQLRMGVRQAKNAPLSTPCHLFIISPPSWPRQFENEENCQNMSSPVKAFKSMRLFKTGDRCMRSLWTRSRESRQHGGRVSVASEVTRNATFPAGYTTQPNKKYWASSISPISNHIEKARQNKILGKTLLPPPPSPKHEEPKECILKTIETIVVPAFWTTF